MEDSQVFMRIIITFLIIMSLQLAVSAPTASALGVVLSDTMVGHGTRSSGRKESKHRSKSDKARHGKERSLSSKLPASPSMNEPTNVQAGSPTAAAATTEAVVTTRGSTEKPATEMAPGLA